MKVLRSIVRVERGVTPGSIHVILECGHVTVQSTGRKWRYTKEQRSAYCSCCTLQESQELEKRA